MSAFAAGIVVFLTSAAVLVLEILAGRLLAPFVGVSLETYTGIIGTVLAGIAFGSWWGGRAADRVDPRLLIGPLVVLGGALALFTVPIVLFLGAAFAGGGVLEILLLSFGGFFAPAVVLSAVTPTVVKLRLSNLDETGQVVGRLSALGTAGAIAGTFLTGFVLVSAVPTRATIFTLGGALLAGGLVLWWWLAPRAARDSDRGGSLHARTHTYAVVGLLGASLTFAAQQPCAMESAYYCARVETDPQRESGRVLVLDSLTHSYVDLDDPSYLDFGYMRAFADAIEAAAADGHPLEVLHIGGGGFSLPRWLAAQRPGSRSLVLEIDPRLVDLARRDLGLVTGPEIRVRVGDARIALDEIAGDDYDVVVGDAFGGLAVPWHLTTAEFTREVARVLRPGGLYVINVIDGPPMRFARAQAATLAAVFDHVAVLTEPERVDGRAGGNVVLAASDAPLPVEGIRERISGRGATGVVVEGAALRRWIDGARVLTDDRAPVDQLLRSGR